MSLSLLLQPSGSAASLPNTNNAESAAAAAVKQYSTHGSSTLHGGAVTSPYSLPSLHSHPLSSTDALTATYAKVSADLKRAAATAAATARGIEQDDEEDEGEFEEEEEDEKAVPSTIGGRLPYENPYFSHYSASVSAPRVITGNTAPPMSLSAASMQSGSYPSMPYGPDVPFGNPPPSNGPVSYQSLEARNHALFIMTNGNARVDRYGNFHCLLCFKKFTRNSNLRRHLRIHEAVKRFKCSHCSKRFMEKHHLDAHERIHSGARPFQCPACFRSFADRSNCSRHIKTHGNGYQMPIVLLDTETTNDREYSRESNEDQMAAAAHLQAVSQRPREGVRIKSSRNGAVAEEHEAGEYDDDAEEEVHEEEEEEPVHHATPYAAALAARLHQTRPKPAAPSAARDGGEETDDDNNGHSGHHNAHASNRRHAAAYAAGASSLHQSNERHHHHLTGSSASSSHHFRSSAAAELSSGVSAKVEPSATVNTATPSPLSAAPIVPVNGHGRSHNTTLFNSSTTRLSPSMPPLQPVTASAANGDSIEVVSPSGRRYLTTRGAIDMSLDGPMQLALKAAQAAKDVEAAKARGHSNVSEASSSSSHSGPSPTPGQSSSLSYGRYPVPGPKLHVPVRAKRPLDGDKRDDEEEEEDEEGANTGAKAYQSNFPDQARRKRRRSKLSVPPAQQLTPALQAQAQAAAAAASAAAAATGSTALFANVTPATFLQSFLPGGANYNHPLAAAQGFFQNPAAGGAAIAPAPAAPAAPAPAPSAPAPTTTPYYPQPYSPFNFLQQSPPQPPPVIPPAPPALPPQPNAVYPSQTVAYNPFGYALPPLPAIPPLPNPAHHPVPMFPPTSAADMVAAQQHAIAQQHANAAYAATIRQLQLTGR